MLRKKHREGVLHARGISDAVIDGAPMRYESFDKGDWERFLYLMAMTFMLKLKQPPLKGKVSQTSGVVIRRFSLDGKKPPPYARLDHPVLMKKGGEPTHYIYRPGYKQKHTDAHPMAAARLRQRQAVYFCLEGSLKADAVLSGGGVSISSTSVTTWECLDLKKLLPILREAPVVNVVPDSDYYSSPRFDGSFNPMVLWQTRKAAKWLGSRGVNAEIRVPWIGMEAGKVGVDDYLAKGYSLGGLASQEPHHRPHIVAGHPLTKSQTRILQWLLDQQGAYGAFYPGEVAKAVGVDRKTVYRAYKRFEELGIMRVWKGKVVKTQGGFVQAPDAYHINEPWDMDYGSWLRRIPIPSGRG